jgi:dolichol kinase
LDIFHYHFRNKKKNRNAMNKRRKFMHATWGLLFATLNHFVPTRVFVPAMAIVTTGTLILELLRYREGFEWMNDTMHKALGHALRKNEMDGRFTGSFYYFLGVTVTAALYPKSCATLGICQLAIADPTASYFGRATRHVYWSRIGNGLGGLGRNKGMLGFLGGAVACVPLNYRLLSLAKFPDPTGVTSKTIVMASLALGLAGAFADLIVPTPSLTLPKKVCGVSVPPFHVDDNCIVPILSGLACQQIFRHCHWPTDLELATHLFVR